jgi:outer membrane lipoprotein-sorting protein
VAQAAPALPARTPAQLLAEVAGAKAPPPLTGTVVETASLGIPQLPGAGNPTSITSLLTGSHTLRVWYADPAHVRLSAPVTMGESDLIRNGRTVWFWQSSNNSVTKVLLPPHSRSGDGGEAFQAPLTPQQAAQQVLAAVGKTTRVTTETNVTVAGQAAYQLVLAPKDSRSLIGRVTIAVDGAHPGVPLRVQVFARGAKAPAFSVGYTSISFVRPAAANFQFTPPKGAHVTTVPGRGGWSGYGRAGAERMVAPGYGSFRIPPGGGTGVQRGIHLNVPPRHWIVTLPGGRTVTLRPGEQLACAPRVLRGIVKLPPHGSVSAPLRPAKLAELRQRWVKLCAGKAMAGHLPAASAAVPPMALAPRVIGEGWLSVAVLPDSVLGGLGGGNAAGAAGQAARSVAGDGGSVDNAAIVAALLKAAHPVQGSWGSGRLLHTSLVSILITNGHVLVGAVTPQVLYAAAAGVK